MGSSVVDYVIAATNLFNDIVYFEVLPSVESYHLPICWSLNTNLNKSNHGSQYNHENHDNELNNMDTHEYTKYKWNDNHSDEFNAHLNSNSCLEILKAAKDCIASNCDLAIELLTQALQSSASHMLVKPPKQVKNRSRNFWFDDECRQLKAKQLSLLRKFRRSNNADDFDRYRLTKVLYKSLCKQKKDLHKQKLKFQMEENISNSKKFWGTVKSVLVHRVAIKVTLR